MKNLIIKISKIVLLVVFLILFMIVFITYSSQDKTFLYDTTQLHTTQNYLGAIGAQCAALLLYLFGCTVFLFVPLVVWIISLIITDRSFRPEKDRIWGLVLFLPVCCAVLHHYGLEFFSGAQSGGLVGMILYKAITVIVFNFYVGSFLYVATCGLLLLILRFSFVRYLYPFYAMLLSIPVIPWGKKIYDHAGFGYNYAAGLMVRFLGSVPDTSLEDAVHEIYSDPIWQTLGIPARLADKADTSINTTDSNNAHQVPTADTSSDNAIDRAVEVRTLNTEKTNSEKPKPEKKIEKHYSIPNKQMLAVAVDMSIDIEQQKESTLSAQILQTKLERFGIHGKVTSIINGPVVTLFEYQPTIDTKVSTILARENDLALALQAISLRIIAPIPGRSVVGFEVAHNKRKTVYFSALLQSKSWSASKGTLPLIIGQDTLGENIVIDLSKMPHLLVAGSTGSGKSAGLNAMLMSLLYSKTPHELRFVLIDPKRLEFASYADIAHLLFPIITEPTKAVLALKWLVRTMEERYEAMARLAVRNIDDFYKTFGYNSEHHMPYIVVVIDELADLMMTASKDAEQLIARLAQMARAAGIHLIIATQRPSVDVITGLIKVNFPSRIAFKVTSKIDSRTIIDGSGAEKLLGRGDMLFLDSAGSLKRVHGAYVSDEEINKAVSYIKAQQKVVYEELMVPQAAQESIDDEDDIFDDVIDFVLKRDDISISLVQRAFRIGYNRSARLIDQLEVQGYILPADGGKMRKVIKK